MFCFSQRLRQLRATSSDFVSWSWRNGEIGEGRRGGGEEERGGGGEREGCEDRKVRNMWKQYMMLNAHPL